MSAENRSGFGSSVNTSKDEFGTGWWLLRRPDGIFFFRDERQLKLSKAAQASSNTNNQVKLGQIFPRPP